MSVAVCPLCRGHLKKMSKILLIFFFFLICSEVFKKIWVLVLKTKKCLEQILQFSCSNNVKMIKHHIAFKRNSEKKLLKSSFLHFCYFKSTEQVESRFSNFQIVSGSTQISIPFSIRLFYKIILSFSIEESFFSFDPLLQSPNYILKKLIDTIGSVTVIFFLVRL